MLQGHIGSHAAPGDVERYMRISFPRWPPDPHRDSKVGTVDGPKCAQYVTFKVRISPANSVCNYTRLQPAGVCSRAQVPIKLERPMDLLEPNGQLLIAWETP